MANIFDGVKNVHFIGIGGSGMFPIAQIFLKKGYKVSGSDNNYTTTIKILQEQNIQFFDKQSKENVKNAEIVIYSAAISEDNEELVAAKNLGIPVYKRSFVLGELTKDFANTVAVCGTHGKTTVTSMLTQIFLDANRDPSAIIGGKLRSIGGSGHIGNSGDMVIEACEYQNTFHDIHPNNVVLLNIDLDHMEFFKTEDFLLESFKTFCSSAAGTLIYNAADARSVKVASGLSQKKLSFGWDNSVDFYPQNIRKPGKLDTDFDIYHSGELFCSATMHVPGKHNILNAVAACAAAFDSGISAQDIAKGISNFHGAGRRFEFLGEWNGVTVVDDYAHHPAELEVTLTAAAELGFNRVWALHQPFTYTRTARLLDDFARVLSIADRVVLTEIMGSREKNDIGIYSADLAKKIPPEKQTVVIADYDECAQYIRDNAAPGDLVITLGCGDVNKIATKIIE
jgi:UDP-N-acetylmuramate--alanine ligase